ncbi:MAG: type II toxin-antitoxin system VapC family toxin [Candidatus Cloacimonetes bacterium]|nr:type II toxin-antitoxin system VapC family toxin [Candidatus Cloacimonadota bacterium]MCF8393989.1 type II toxin-antitoxin system VapC family toxin [Melioribacteraceae bacterium]
MKYMLDTNVFLWLIEDNPKLTQKVRRKFTHPKNTIYLSIVSLWEIAIKTNIGKLKLEDPFSVFIDKYVFENYIEILDLKIDHIKQFKELEYYHKDPFDRTIIAQSISEDISLIASDKIFSKYPVKVLW